jgi:prophage maintenance system killer protein
MREFAMRNGFMWSDPSEDEAVAVMEDAAAGSLSEKAFAVWVRERLAYGPRVENSAHNG